MTRNEHYYWKLVEKCAEVIQRAAKSKQFGDDEVQPEQPLDNMTRLVGEVNDLRAIIKIMEDDDIIAPLVEDSEFLRVVNAKRAKLQKFLDLSIARGHVTP